MRILWGVTALEVDRIVCTDRGGMVLVYIDCQGNRRERRKEFVKQ